MLYSTRRTVRRPLTAPCCRAGIPSPLSSDEGITDGRTQRGGLSTRRLGVTSLAGSITVSLVFQPLRSAHSRLVDLHPFLVPTNTRRVGRRGVLLRLSATFEPMLYSRKLPEECRIGGTASHSLPSNRFSAQVSPQPPHPIVATALELASLLSCQQAGIAELRTCHEGTGNMLESQRLMTILSVLPTYRLLHLPLPSPHPPLRLLLNTPARPAQTRPAARPSPTSTTRHPRLVLPPARTIRRGSRAYA